MFMFNVYAHAYIHTHTHVMHQFIHTYSTPRRYNVPYKWLTGTRLCFKQQKTNQDQH